VRELAPDDIGISVSYPLPGTKFHARVQDRMGDKRNWRESDDLDPLFPGRFSRGFYRTLSRTVHAEFRTRRGWRALRELTQVREVDGERLRRLRGLTELPVWLAGQARLLPQAVGLNARKDLR